MTTSRLALCIAILLMLFSVESRGVLMTFDFFQGGYPNGASVSGSFAVNDLNGDGVVTGDGEGVFGFSAIYSGSSNIPIFGVGGSSTAFRFDLTRNILSFSFENPSPGVLDQIAIDLAGIGTISYRNGTSGPILSDRSSGAVIVTLAPVTVPDGGATITLLGITLGGMGFIPRRRQVHGN
jgi:hypothetical protein